MDHSIDSSATPRVGAIIQARMGSSRLPGKALLTLPLGGTLTILDHVIRRARRSGVAVIVVATSTLPANDAVAAAVRRAGAQVYRGSETDVLARFQEAAAAHQLDTIVRLTADNPAIDPHYVRQALQQHHLNRADYTHTTGLPLGTNLEIISGRALALAHAQAQLPDEREHVTPYLRRHPAQFQLQELNLATQHPGWAGFRLTVDYPSDYALLHTLYTTLPTDFGLAEVAVLHEQYPWLPLINADNQQVRVA
ncbi:cytidylyltransferase domain-containing protein [Hymenobacter guriensis]|uniref:NTP transferase domain-containing protein n=1 Tax=Hymenobacter guriensis TaxID=2793065 RepID=A0ABS0L3W1_9BACT|nr:NTP transferase domain-containing protein [Hymenobacter guriensis]MBG8554814.1 NTP transferase domain-containing protein [Hymenobacter guriensis]